MAGGIPIFAESEEDTLGLDVEDVKKKITKKTRAIIALHYGGFPSKDIEKLRQIANEHKILLIEDAAEALGSHINKKKIGTFGHSAIFSFCQNKIISTGEGGVVVTDSGKIYEKLKLIRSHGRVALSKNYFYSIDDSDYTHIGYNFRMSTILTALGLSQLNKIDKLIKLRRKKACYLNEHLSKIKDISFPKKITKHYSVYQMYTIKLLNKKTRDNLQKYLEEKGIMSKIYFNPVHLKTIYKNKYGYKEGSLPKSEHLSKTVLTLPLYPSLSKKELNFIISVIKSFFKNYRSV